MYGRLKKKDSITDVFQIFFFIDGEQLSKNQISLQVIFKDFVDRLGTTYLENGILWSYF